MAELGLEFDRLRAVEVSDIDPQDLAHIATQWERPMRANEVACLKSHQSAWQLIADGQVPVLVLEDDILLSAKTPELLLAIEKCQLVDRVSLETRSRKKLLGRTGMPDRNPASFFASTCAAFRGFRTLTEFPRVTASGV